MSEEVVFEAKGGVAGVGASGFGWSSVVIGRERVVFRNLVNDEEVMGLGEVKLIVGELGMVPDEGSPLSWKRLLVKTEDGRRFVTQFDPRTNARLYRALLEACPQALGVDADGNVTIGAPPEDAAEMGGWIEETARVVRREFLRQGRGLLLWGVATGVGGLACIAFSVQLFLGPVFVVNMLTKLIFLGAMVLPCAAIAMICVGARKMARGARLCRRIRATQEGRPLEEGVLKRRGWRPAGLPPE